MYLNHTQAFGAIDFDLNSVAAHPEQHATTLCSDTLLETEHGWRPVHALQPGDRVHSVDGGLVPITSVTPRPHDGEALWHVPAQALNNCSDMWLTDAQHVALSGTDCERLYGTPYVLAPVSALSGYRGIRPEARASQSLIDLACEHEEILFAQTGALLHVTGPGQAPFFRRLSYGETRAILTLLSCGHVQPDPVRFAA